MTVKCKPQRKNDLIKELAKLLEEQDPEGLDKIFHLAVEMIREYKHLSMSRHYR